MKKLLSVILLMFASISYAQFSQFNITGTNSLNSVSTINDQVVYVGGNGGIWKTTDAGISFVKVFSAVSVRDMKFVGPTGYVIYDNNDSLLNVSIAKTTNDGLNWQTCFTTPDSVVFFRLCLMTDNIIFANFPGAAYGKPSELWRSKDGGSNWHIVYSTNIYAFQAVACSIDFVYVVGSQLFFSSGNLSFWQSSSTPFAFPFSNAVCTFNNRLHAAGDTWINNNCYPIVSSTTNKGDNWSSYIFPDSGQVMAIDFLGNQGYALGSTRGSSGYHWIEKTTNGGLNWQRVYSNNFPLSLLSLSITYSYLYAVGNNGSTGIVLRYDPLVTIIENNTTPSEFNLKQNYPNPFNPVTKISYSLSKASFVNLKVYDIFGREVKTLVRENKKAGEHDIDFDGSLLSSGVYFYKLIAGEFFQTKKMMLVK